MGKILLELVVTDGKLDVKRQVSDNITSTEIGILLHHLQINNLFFLNLSMQKLKGEGTVWSAD